MKIEIDISDNIISNTIAAGDIRYWGQVISLSADSLTMTIRENDGGKTFTLTPASWPPAIVQMFTGIAAVDGRAFTRRHFWTMIGEHGDAETGDVLIQLACFGEIKYG